MQSSTAFRMIIYLKDQSVRRPVRRKGPAGHNQKTNFAIMSVSFVRACGLNLALNLYK